jgi:hypothetical protein
VPERVTARRDEPRPRLEEADLEPRGRVEVRLLRQEIERRDAPDVRDDVEGGELARRQQGVTPRRGG